MHKATLSGRAAADARNVVERDGLCGICPAGCWVTVSLEDGAIKSVRPQDHPLGMICTNGAHSGEIVNDPDRLQYPLRRTGPKGSHEFERISWDDAFGIIVENLQRLKAEHGPESTAIYTGRGSFELALCDVFQPEGVAISSASSVLFPFGSPNTLGVGALCYVSFAMIAPHSTLGEYYHTMDHDIENAEMIVIWGANPATDSPPLAHEQIKRAVLRGAEVICIDPQRNHTAREVDAEWIPVRPGADGALALGMINVLIEEELFDEGFVKSWTLGFEELASYVQHFRPEVVEDITGVPAETVVRLARRIARARGACPVMYTGLEYSDSGVQAIRAVFTLWALAGQLDVPGGLNIRMRENQFPINRQGLVPNPDAKKALGRDRFPVYSMYRGESHAIALPDSVLKGEPYKVRGLVILGGSIITAWPNPSIWRETLGALDFLVSINRHHTADSAYADIVLPATTGYEITSYMTYGPIFKIREKIVEPVGEARNDLLILAKLADRLGYGDLYPQSEEELLRHVLDGSGFTLEDVNEAGGEVRIDTVMTAYKKWEKGGLREDGRPGFRTPSGKFEITSSVLDEHGYDALPVYTEPGEGPLAQPALAQQYPLVFNSGARIFADFRSQHHGVEGLSLKAPAPLVTMNANDAAQRGIADGDWVWVNTPRGRAKYQARLTDDIVAGSIDANMGGGGPLGPQEWQDCNVNDLTDLNRYDPISGFPVYKALLCEVVKAEGGNGSVRRAEEESEAVIQANEIEKPLRYVYLDHNATTPVDPEVLEAIMPHLQAAYGNPSSIHSRGNEARDAVEAARRTVAQALGCTARRVVFTGGGSESDNLAIKGAALARRETPATTSSLQRSEHPAVLTNLRGACRSSASRSLTWTSMRVAVSMRRTFERLRSVRRRYPGQRDDGRTARSAPSIPIAELARVAHDCATHCFIVTRCQGLGKLPHRRGRVGRRPAIGLQLTSCYGPKGVGALYARKDVELHPVIHGGGQERKLRAGTENVPGIVGFGKGLRAGRARRLNHNEMDRVRQLRDRLEAGVREIVPEARLNGHPERPAPQHAQHDAARHARRVAGPLHGPPRRLLLVRVRLQVRQSRTRPTCSERWGSQRRRRPLRHPPDVGSWDDVKKTWTTCWRACCQIIGDRQSSVRFLACR